MSLNKIFSFTVFCSLVSGFAFSENHDLDLKKNSKISLENIKTQKPANPSIKKEEKSPSIEEQLNNVPLNNPFGGGVGTGGGETSGQTQSTAVNSISALQGKKLVGIIEGNRKRFALFQSANGSIQMISEDDYLTNDLFVREINKEVVLIENAEKKVFEVAFNNYIRPMEGN